MQTLIQLRGYFSIYHTKSQVRHYDVPLWILAEYPCSAWGHSHNACVYVPCSVLHFQQRSSLSSPVLLKLIRVWTILYWINLLLASLIHSLVLERIPSWQTFLTTSTESTQRACWQSDSEGILRECISNSCVNRLFTVTHERCSPYVFHHVTFLHRI